MTFCKPAVKIHGLSLIFIIIIGILISPAYAVPISSNISITSPADNGFISSTTVTIGGSYVSPDSTPTVILTVDGTNYTQSVGSGSWSTSLTLDNGWHQAMAILQDSNGIKKTSEQFLIWTGNMKTTKYPVIAIEYSQACLALLKSKTQTSCPTLYELKKFDTSNQKISGKFEIKNQTWIRTKPQVTNHYMFYTDQKNKAVCVACQIDLINPDIVQVIFIEPSGFSYLKHNFSTVVESNVSINSTVNVNYRDASLTIFYDRYVDDGCNTANMDYSTSLMADTIGYLKSGCTVTNFNKTSTSVVPSHPFVMDSRYSSLRYDAILTSVFHGVKQLHNENVPTGGGLGPGNCITKTTHACDVPDSRWK